MIRIAATVGLGLFVSSGAVARAQSAPQAYSLKAEGTIADRKLTVTVLRDGARERVEHAIQGAGVMASLYDFEAHKVYWIGWSGAGTCSSGRYLSARAPVGEDPVTGTAENLVELGEGRARKASGTGSVGGRPARIEAFAGGKRPAGKDQPPWPKRVWLAEDGGYLLKLEGEDPTGKPVTLLEVTQLTFATPSGAALKPPSECISTDSEMDDSGSIRSHAAASVEVKATATADLGTGTTSGTVTQAEKGSGPARAGALAKVNALTVSAVEQPGAAPCGAKLQLTGTIAVDGPATLRYRFQPGVGGLQFPEGQDGLVTLDAAGITTLVREAVASRSLKGQLRLQATVQGTKGHNGPLKTSDPVPFQLTCAGK